MKKKIYAEPTVLNKNDRRILEKYSGFYTNFIESNTAKSSMKENQKYNTKE